MSDNYLTQSDFKVAQTCPTKLYYRKSGYPTLADGDEYLAMMADQSYLIEAVARALFPDGRYVGFRPDVEAAAWDTMSALGDPCTLFDATFISRGKLARVHVLTRRADRFELFMVGSRSFDRGQNDALLAAGKPGLLWSASDPAALRPEWRPLVEDAAFQTAIVQELFPRALVSPFLLLPDAAAACPVDGLPHLFNLRPNNDQMTTDFTGDPRLLRRNPLLARVDVSAEVAAVLPDVRRHATAFAAALIPAITRLPTPLSTHCRNCEYHVADGARRGFHECWGALADVSPHILDLYGLDEAGGPAPLADQLIARGRAGLVDLPARRVTGRQRIQIAHTRANREWRSEDLGPILKSLLAPLNFLAIESRAPAIPRYRGMRPFEAIPFQWSGRTLSHPDAAPQADHWQQTTDDYPHVAFAAALRRCLGENGAVLVWSGRALETLADARRQLIDRDADGELVAWLGRLLDGGRLVDLRHLAVTHYFHPRQGGRMSLPDVAGAVWSASPGLRAFLSHQDQDLDGQLPSPFATLPLLSMGGRQVSMIEGPGLLLAYDAMLERAAAGATLEADRWRALLRRAGDLKALALFMIWRHWSGSATTDFTG